MSQRRLPLLGVFILLFSLFGALPARADVPTKGITSYEAMTAELHGLQARNGVHLEAVESSNEGRAIWLAGVGHGPRTILITAQQHGNEPHGSEAVLDLLADLARSNSREARMIRDSVTIWVMPRVNPDGAAHNWRQNADPECSNGTPECTPGRGIDPNRWHDPTIPDDEVPAPETRAIRAVHERIEPDLMIDVHGQLSYVDEQGRQITGSVAWPVIADADLTPEREAAVTEAMRVSAVMADAVNASPHGVASRFPAGDGKLVTARNAYAWQGTPTVLFEQRSDSGDKDLRPLVREGVAALRAAIVRAADGSLADVDPERAEALPERGLAVGPERPRPPARCQPSRPEPGSGTVLDRDESLRDLVAGHGKRLIGRDSEAYRRPTRTEACDLGRAFALLEAARVDEAADLVASHGYGVVRVHDPDTGRDHLALAEDPNGTGTYQRGWGLFVHTPAARSTTTIMAPYPRARTDSAPLAAEIAERDDAQNLLVSGAHREANRADADTYEPANPTTASESAMRRVAAEAVDRGEVSLQVLGTSGDSVSLSSGTVPPTDLARDLDRALTGSGYATCLYADGCDALGSTGNLLAQDARALRAEPLVLYPPRDVRTDAAQREKFTDVVADAL